MGSPVSIKQPAGWLHGLRRTPVARLSAAACRVCFLGLLSLGPLLGCNDGGGPYGSPYGGYNDPCRYDPGRCGGGLGAVCGANIDCGAGFCCRAPKECGGGMCTLSCRSNLDCPADMTCDHDVCFFACSTDLDCAAGQHCAHAHTACEW